MMTEPKVLEVLESLIRRYVPQRMVELGAGPSSTPMLKATAAALGISFDSVDTQNHHATIKEDAIVWMRANPESVDFLFSDAGSWEVRVACAKQAPEVLRAGGIVAFHDIQPNTPLRSVLDAMGAQDIVAPGLGGGTYGGLALWRKP